MNTKNFLLVTQRAGQKNPLYAYYATREDVIGKIVTYMSEHFTGKIEAYEKAGDEWTYDEVAMKATESLPIPEQQELCRQLLAFFNPALKQKNMFSDEQKLELQRLVESLYQLEGMYEEADLAFSAFFGMPDRQTDADRESALDYAAADHVDAILAPSFFKEVL